MPTAPPPAPATPWWASETSVPAAPVRRPKWKGFVAAFVGVLAVVLLLATAARNPGRTVETTPSGATIQPPTLESLAAGCTGIITRPPVDPNTVGWVADEAKNPAWKTVPPVAGNFSPTPYTGPRIVYPDTMPKMTLTQSVALLYRGWTVIWYRPAAKDYEIRDAARYVGDLPPNAKTVVAAWPYGDDYSWGSAHPWAIVGWDTAQGCSTFNPTVADEFRAVDPGSKAPGTDVPLDQPGPQARTRSK